MVCACFVYIYIHHFDPSKNLSAESNYDFQSQYIICYVTYIVNYCKYFVIIYCYVTYRNTKRSVYCQYG